MISQKTCSTHCCKLICIHWHVGRTLFAAAKARVISKLCQTSQQHGMHVQACRLPPPAGPVATCLMATLWGSCITLEGLFQASALGQSADQGNAWLQAHVAGRLMQDAATMARIAAELYRLVDEPSQQVNMPRAYLAPCACKGTVVST